MSFAIFIAFLAAHAVADFSLQTEFMTLNKSRTGPVGAVFWPYCLFSHAAVNGFAVTLVVGVFGDAPTEWAVAFGVFETFAHAVIDFAKGEGWFGAGMSKRAIALDQGLHALCKVLWVGLLLLGGLI